MTAITCGTYPASTGVRAAGGRGRGGGRTGVHRCTAVLPDADDPVAAGRGEVCACGTESEAPDDAGMRLPPLHQPQLRELAEDLAVGNHRNAVLQATPLSGTPCQTWQDPHTAHAISAVQQGGSVAASMGVLRSVPHTTRQLMRGAALE